MAKLDKILEDLIRPEGADLSVDLARYVLSMRFSDENASRYSVLAEKNQHGTLTPKEREELEAFVTANSLLMILKSKARLSLAEHQSAA